MRSFVVKKIYFAVPAMVLSLAGISAAQSASAPVKVGVIQIQAALVSTKDGQAAAADFEKKMEPRRKELEKAQGEIKDMQEKLQRNANTMAQAAKDDLTRNIDRKSTQLQRDTQDAQAEADEEQQKLVRELSEKMMPIIDKYAQEK